MKFLVQPWQTRLKLFSRLLVPLAIMLCVRAFAQSSSESGSQIAGDLVNEMSFVLPVAYDEPCSGGSIPYAPQGGDNDGEYYYEDYFVPGGPNDSYTFNLAPQIYTGSAPLCDAAVAAGSDCPNCNSCDCNYYDEVWLSVYRLELDTQTSTYQYEDIYDGPDVWLNGPSYDYNLNPYEVPMYTIYGQLNGLGPIYGTDVIRLWYANASDVAEYEPKANFRSASCTSSTAGAQSTISYGLPALPSGGSSFDPGLDPDNFFYPEWKFLVNDAGCTIDQDTGEITTGSGTGEIEVECYEGLTLGGTVNSVSAALSQDYVTETIQVVKPPEIELDPAKPFKPYAGGPPYEQVYLKVSSLSTFNGGYVNWSIDTDPNDSPYTSALECSINQSGVVTLGNETGTICIKAADPDFPDYYILAELTINPQPVIELDHTLAVGRDVQANVYDPDQNGVPASPDPNAISSPKWSIVSEDPSTLDCSINSAGLISIGSESDNTGTITIQVADGDNGYYLQRTETIHGIPTFQLTTISGQYSYARSLIDGHNEWIPLYENAFYPATLEGRTTVFDVPSLIITGPDLGCQYSDQIGGAVGMFLNSGGATTDGNITLLIADDDNYALDIPWRVRVVPSLKYAPDPVGAWGAITEPSPLPLADSGDWVGGINYEIYDPPYGYPTSGGVVPTAPVNVPTGGTPTVTIDPSTGIFSSIIPDNYDLPFWTDIVAYDPTVDDYYAGATIVTYAYPQQSIPNPPTVSLSASAVPTGGSIKPVATLNNAWNMNLENVNSDGTPAGTLQVWWWYSAPPGTTMNSDGVIIPGNTPGEVQVFAEDQWTSWTTPVATLSILEPEIGFNHTVLLANGSSSATATLADPNFFVPTAWSVSGPGTLSSQSDSSCFVNAGTGPGTITVTAASGSIPGEIVQNSINVVAIPTVSFSKSYLTPGSQATASLSDPDDFPNVTWSLVSGPSGVTVSSGGTVTVSSTASDGAVTVQAETSPDNYTFTGTINVQSTPEITFTPSSLPASSHLTSQGSALSETLTQFAVVDDPNNTQTKVNPNTGVVTPGVQPGTVTIAATDQNGYTLEGTFNVTTPLSVAFTQDPLTADGQSATWASVKPPGSFSAVIWSLRGSTYGCQINPNTGEVLAGKVSGQITVQGTDPISGDYVQGTLQLKGGCLTACATGNCVGGGGEFNNNSVDVGISLGYVDYGQTPASLQFEVETPSASEVTPQLLWVAGSYSPDVEVIPNSATDPTIQQVRTPTMLAVVQVISSSQYDVNLYDNSQFNQQPHTPGTPYTINSGATPFCTWTIANPTSGNYNTVVVTETRGGNSYVATYNYRTDLGSVGNGWDMVVDGGARLERRTMTDNPTVNTQTYTIMDTATETPQYQEVRTYQNFAWGQELTQLTVGIGANAQTTTWTYYTDSSDANDYMHIQQVVLPTGSWETYKYDSQGRQIQEVSQFLDNPPTSAVNQNRVTTTTYDDVNNIADQEVTLRGVEISHTYTQTVPSVNGSDDLVETVQCQNQGVTSMTAAGNLATYNYTCPAGSQTNYLPQLTIRPDGTIVLYSYTIADGQETKTVKEGQPNANNTDVVDGTETVTVLDDAGNVISEQEFDIKNNSLPLESKIATSQDLFGRPLTYAYGDGSAEEMTYDCCGLETFTDRSGMQASYNYDNMKRLSMATTNGVSTLYDYNVIGKIAGVTRVTPDGSGSDNTVLESYQYDTAGRQIQSIDLIGPTTTAYSTDASGEPVVTTTYPNQSTAVETYYQDGNTLSISGSAVYPSTYQYGVDSTGYYKTETYPRGSSTAEWVKTSIDMLNRQYLISYPADGTGNTPTTEYYYSQTTGQLWKQTDPDGVATLFVYNNRGELFQQAIDMDRNNQISTAIDRVQEYDTTFQPNSQDTEMLVVKNNYVWDQPPSGPVKTEILATTYALDGSYTNTTSFGQSTTSTVSYNPASQTETVTETLPDNTEKVSVYVNDQLNSVTSSDASNPRQQLSQQTYQYYTSGPDCGFLQSVADARDGTTSYTYNSAFEIASMTTPAPGFAQTTPEVTQYTYNDLNPAGRVVTTTLPDQSTVTRTYQLTGELKLITGSGVIPTDYEYEQGRIKTIETWQTYGNNATAETTTFNYSPDRGFLQSKTYPNSSGPTYTYFDSGRVETRTWSGGATTTYAYNNAADESQVSYSDSTPTVTYNYNARGQISSVTDGSGTCATAYYNNGLPETETHTGGPLGGVVVQYNYDSNLRRQNTIVSKNGTQIYEQDNTYNRGDSRLRDVTFNGICAQYGYEPNSSLVNAVTLKQGNESGATILTNSREHNYLNQLAQTVTAGAGATVSFTAQFNALNKRQQITLQDGSYWVYSYDSHGQVTSGKKYWSDGTPVAGQQFEYAFDDVGNRVSTKAGGDQLGQNLRTAQYQVNSDNQYTSRTVPHYVDIMGTANPLATVTVALSPTSILQTQRKGDYFWTQVPVPNTYQAGPVYTPEVVGQSEQVTVQAVRPDLQQPQDVMSAFTKTLILPPSPQNLTGEGFNYDWNDSWDAEDRLASMTRLATTSPSSEPTETKLTFTYDYMGRRIEKLVQTSANSGQGPWTTISDIRYVYDAWNLLAELDANGNLLRSYAWGATDNGGVDNSGASVPLMVQSAQGTTGTYYVAQDLVGNVNSLFNTVDGTQAAVFDYGPFGEPMRSTGVAAEVCPFGFAGKYCDAETGLIYYGYRFYDPSQGRWLSRDPSDESGGVNLYGFVNNDPINEQDLLGLTPVDDLERAGGYISELDYDLIMLVPNLGNVVIHPFQTADSVNFLLGLSPSQIKCLLGQQWDEYENASPSEQGAMAADAIFALEMSLLGGEGDTAELGQLEQLEQGAQADADVSELYTASQQAVIDSANALAQYRQGTLTTLIDGALYTVQSDGLLSIVGHGNAAGTTVAGLTPDALAQVLYANGFANNGIQQVELVACYGGNGFSQALANELQVPVSANINTVSVLNGISGLPQPTVASWWSGTKVVVSNPNFGLVFSMPQKP